MSQSQASHSIRELAQKAVQANKEHQRALKVYTEKLEAELHTVDKLMDSVDVIDLEDEPELDVEGIVVIPGSVRAAAPIPPKGLSSLDSPFHNDAVRRTRYLDATEVHPMRAKELETLREAVRTENYRKHALDSQRRGLPAFSDMSDQPPNYLELNTEGLDWDRIAEKVSTASMTTRTTRECEIRWLGDLHPDFNHKPWTQEEISRLKSLLAKGKGSPPNWVDIAKDLDTNRTPLDCMRHGTTRKLHIWTTQSDERLLKAVRMYGHNNWSLVARYVSEDATASQCSNRYQRTLDPDIRRAKWTVEEDARLRIAVAAYGTSWIDVAAVMPGRHNDQCREHWNEQVNPAINRCPWTAEEDNILLGLVRAAATPDWKEIGEHLNTGRTDNMCRSRYATLQRGLKHPALLVNDQPAAGQISDSSLPTTETSHDEMASQASAPAPFCQSDTAPLLRKEATPRNALLFLDPVVGSNPALYKPVRRRLQPEPTWSNPTASTDFVAPSSSTRQKNRKEVQEISHAHSDTGGGSNTQSHKANTSTPPGLETSNEVRPLKKRKTARSRAPNAGIGQSVLRFDSVVSTYGTATSSFSATPTWVPYGASISTYPCHFQGTSPTEHSTSNEGTQS